jgi:hypothetical protein
MLLIIREYHGYRCLSEADLMCWPYQSAEAFLQRKEANLL